MDESLHVWLSLYRFAEEGPDERNRLPLPSFGIRSSLGSSPLHFTVLGDNIEMARLLLDHNMNPNESNCYGETPLHWAYHMGSLEMIQTLLDGGALTNLSDNDGETPLQWTEESEHTEAASFLK